MKRKKMNERESLLAKLKEQTLLLKLTVIFFFSLVAVIRL